MTVYIFAYLYICIFILNASGNLAWWPIYKKTCGHAFDQDTAVVATFIYWREKEKLGELRPTTVMWAQI